VTPNDTPRRLKSDEQERLRVSLRNCAEAALRMATRLEQREPPTWSGGFVNALNAACTAVTLLGTRNPLPPSLATLETLEPSVLLREQIAQAVVRVRSLPTPN